MSTPFDLPRTECAGFRSLSIPFGQSQHKDTVLVHWRCRELREVLPGCYMAMST